MNSPENGPEPDESIDNNESDGNLRHEAPGNRERRSSDTAEKIGAAALGDTVESIEDTARREYEEEQSWREYGRFGGAKRKSPKPEEEIPEDKAKRHGIPEDIVRDAAEHGISIDYLIHAKSSGAAGERLRKLGINWGAEPTRETPVGPEDPRISLLRQGKEHRQAVKRIEEQIEISPGELKGNLKRPNGRIPIVRGLREYFKAWRIYSNWREQRDQDQMYDDGLFGLGGEHRRRIKKFIRRHDQEVALARSKLNLINRHELGAIESDRRHLAERILRLRRQQEAFDHDSIDPVDFYAHDEFKKKFKEYGKTEQRAGIEQDKYSEFASPNTASRAEDSRHTAGV